MIVIPAIDILNGECVRLTKGEYGTSETYHKEPFEVAKNFVRAGAKRIHLVDLNGAKEGKLVNTKIIQKIAKNLNVEIEVGGGIRTKEALDYLFSLGVSYVILGSSAVKDKEFLLYSLKKYGERIIVGVDSKSGYVAISGWLEKTNLEDIEFAKELKNLSVNTIIFTDISKDGTLEGPNFSALERMKTLGLNVIASGGISSIEDLRKLKELGLYGAIVGKALYTGKISLDEVFKEF